MADLKLKYLNCKKTEDLTGPDEIYILVNGERVWGPQSVNDGEQPSINVVRGFSGRRVKVELYDQDAGGADDDDHLGTVYASSKPGDFEMKFTGDGANYSLHANVKK